MQFVGRILVACKIRINKRIYKTSRNLRAQGPVPYPEAMVQKPHTAPSSKSKKIRKDITAPYVPALGHSASHKRFFMTADTHEIKPEQLATEVMSVTGRREICSTTVFSDGRTAVVTDVSLLLPFTPLPIPPRPLPFFHPIP